MRKIAILDNFLEPKHLELIRKTAEECGFSVDYFEKNHIDAEIAKDYEVVYGLPRPSAMKVFKNLKWFCTSSAGVDVYTADELYATQDFILTNASGSYGVTIAEHIIMVTLMLLRRMPDFQQIMAQRGWQQSLPMRSIYGSAITVLGTGDIGTEFARRAKAMGASCIRGVRRTDKPGADCFDEMYTFNGLNDTLPKTDILVMALPGTPETAGILSRERLALLPQHAIVVNIGRGSAIDQQALMDALNSEQIAGAALDVMVPEPLPQDSPLWETKNLLLTPHCSGNMSLAYTRDKDTELFCENLRLYAADLPMKRVVDRKKGY